MRNIHVHSVVGPDQQNSVFEGKLTSITAPRLQSGQAGVNVGFLAAKACKQGEVNVLGQQG